MQPGFVLQLRFFYSWIFFPWPCLPEKKQQVLSSAFVFLKKRWFLFLSFFLRSLCFLHWNFIFFRFTKMKKTLLAASSSRNRTILFFFETNFIPGSKIQLEKKIIKSIFLIAHTAQGENLKKTQIFLIIIYHKEKKWSSLISRSRSFCFFLISSKSIWMRFSVSLSLSLFRFLFVYKSANFSLSVLYLLDFVLERRTRQNSHKEQRRRAKQKYKKNQCLCASFPTSHQLRMPPSFDQLIVWMAKMCANAWSFRVIFAPRRSFFFKRKRERREKPSLNCVTIPIIEKNTMKGFW